MQRKLVQVLANFGELRKRAEEVVPFMARSQKRSGGLMPVSESLDSWHLFGIASNACSPIR